MNGSATGYFYDNEDILFEYDSTGNVGNVYIHGLGIDEPLALIQGKDTYYYHADGLGSIVALTDTSQKVVQTYEYDSFGNLHDMKNSVKQPYAFTGREYDRETGLYYYRARYYDSETGRFTSFDPILHPVNLVKEACAGKLSVPSVSFLIGSPKDMNPYSYTSDNPINYTDPIGLRKWTCQWVGLDKVDLEKQGLCTLLCCEEPEDVWDRLCNSMTCKQFTTFAYKSAADGQYNCNSTRIIIENELNGE